MPVRHLAGVNVTFGTVACDHPRLSASLKSATETKAVALSRPLGEGDRRRLLFRSPRSNRHHHIHHVRMRRPGHDLLAQCLEERT